MRIERQRNHARNKFKLTNGCTRKMNIDARWKGKKKKPQKICTKSPEGAIVQEIGGFDKKNFVAEQI